MIYAICIISGIIIGIIAKARGRSFFLWGLYGTFLVFFALPHLLSLPLQNKIFNSNNKDSKSTDSKRCQYCDEDIKKNAVICKHCKSKLTPDIKIIN